MKITQRLHKLGCSRGRGDGNLQTPEALLSIEPGGECRYSTQPILVSWSNSHCL